MIFSYFSIILYIFIMPFLLAKNNKNFALVLFLVLLFFIFITLGLNSQNQDYDAYVDIFINPYFYTEIGYVYLINFLKFLGFQTHRSVLFSLSFLVVYTFYRTYSYSFYFGFLIILYILFLFPLDVIQIRNTFAVFIFLNAVFFFHEKRYILFFLASLVSVLFHSFAFLYISLLLISIFLRGKRSYFRVFLFLIIFYFSMKLSSLLNIRTLSAYFSNGKFLSVVTWGVVVLVFLIMVHYLILNKRTLKILENKGSLRVVVFFHSIILASIAFLPGLYLLFEFNRLYRLVFLLMIIFTSIVFKYISLSAKVFFYIYFLVVFSFFSFYYSNELNYDWVLFGF